MCTTAPLFWRYAATLCPVSRLFTVTMFVYPPIDLTRHRVSPRGYVESFFMRDMRTSRSPSDFQRYQPPTWNEERCNHFKFPFDVDYPGSVIWYVQ